MLARAIAKVYKTFLSLTDTPSSYSGQAGKVVKVNSGETALEFATEAAGRDYNVYAIDYNGGALNSTTINAAITAIGSDEKTLVLTPGDWAMSASITVPVNITLKILPGTTITRSSGTLTINGNIEAPWNTIFKSFASGQIVFGEEVDDVYVGWFDVTEDGSTDDYTPLLACLRSTTNAEIHFTKGKSYRLTAGFPTIATSSGLRLRGNGATLISSVATGPLLTIGNSVKDSDTALSTAFTADTNTFAIPATLDIAVGDLVLFYNNTEYIPGYKRGILTNVIDIVGTTAYIDVLPTDTFTADRGYVFYPNSNVEVDNLFFDNTGCTSATAQGLYVRGRNVTVRNCKFWGATSSAAGLQVSGTNIVVENNEAHDYLCLAPTGSRTGYGILAAGNNIQIFNNIITNCKHNISLTNRTFMSSNMAVKRNTLTQDISKFDTTTTAAGNTVAYYSTIMDAHGNSESIIVEDNTFNGAGFGVISVRNGKMVVKKNTINFLNNSLSYQSTTCAVIIYAETTVSLLNIEDNDITAGIANTPLIAHRTSGHIQSMAAASPETTGDNPIRVDNNNRLTNVVHAGFSTESMAAMTFYVDGTNGTDAIGKGFGSGTSAFATLQYAIDRMPPIFNGTVTINIATGTYAGGIIGGKEPAGNYFIVIKGTLTSLKTGTLDGYVLGSGATQGVLGHTGAFAADVSTTVDADSSGKTLPVTSTTGFAIGDTIIIDPYGAKQEVATVKTITAGVSLNLVSNLVNTHLGADAATVEVSKFANKLLSVSGQERIIDYSLSDDLVICGSWSTAPSGTYNIYDWGTILGSGSSAGIQVRSGQQGVYLNYVALNGSTYSALIDSPGAYLSIRRSKFSKRHDTALLSAGHAECCYYENCGQVNRGANTLYHCKMQYWNYSVTQAVNMALNAVMNIRWGTIMDGYTNTVHADTGSKIDMTGTATAGQGYNRVRNSTGYGLYATVQGGITGTANNQYHNNAGGNEQYDSVSYID